jgi:hypothetical protein
MLNAIDAIMLAGDRRRANDDAFGLAGDRAWVIDGATGLGATLLPGESDAAWIARTANRLFHAHAAIRDTRMLVAAVISGVVDAFEAERLRPPEARWELPVASFLVLTRRPGAIELAWLGDCRALVTSGEQVFEAGETPEGEGRERAMAAQLSVATGGTALLRSAEVIEALRLSRARANTREGRYLLGLHAEAAEHLAVVDCPVAAGRFTALLMTDGFSALELRYQRYGARALVAAAETKGLAALATELRAIEEAEDPDGRVWPRFKRSDDATAALIRG